MSDTTQPNGAKLLVDGLACAAIVVTDRWRIEAINGQAARLFLDKGEHSWVGHDLRELVPGAPAFPTERLAPFRWIEAIGNAASLREYRCVVAPHGRGWLASFSPVDPGETERDAPLLELLLQNTVRNSLWSLLINLPFVVDELPEGDGRAAASDCLHETLRLQRAVQSAGDLVDSLEGSLRIERVTCDLGRLVRDAVQAAALEWKQHQKQVSFQGPSAELMVKVDADRIRRVLDGLVDVAASKARSHVEVSLERYEVAEASFAEIVIRDDRVAARGSSPHLAPAQRKRGTSASGAAASPTLSLRFGQAVAAAHGGELVMQDGSAAANREPGASMELHICISPSDE